MREEADEVAAAAGESDERVAQEAADLLYHLEVLLLSRDVPLAAALEEPMAVAAEASARLEREPARPRAAREANVIPIAHRFVDDVETPVSAFLAAR